MKVPAIETERLILRPLTVDDADAVFEWTSDERVTEYMCYVTYTSVDDVREWLRSVEQAEDEYNFGFVRKSDGKLIGSGSIRNDRFANDKNTWGFGYNFRYDCWGNGYATEATKAMIDFAHREFGACRFSACHHIDNPASGRIMEKCGLHFSHYGEFQKLDGSCKAKSKQYVGVLFE